MIFVTFSRMLKSACKCEIISYLDFRWYFLDSLTRESSYIYIYIFFLYKRFRLVFRFHLPLSCLIFFFPFLFLRCCTQQMKTRTWNRLIFFFFSSLLPQYREFNTRISTICVHNNNLSLFTNLFKHFFNVQQRSFLYDFS